MTTFILTMHDGLSLGQNAESRSPATCTICNQQNECDFCMTLVTTYKEKTAELNRTMTCALFSASRTLSV